MSAAAAPAAEAAAAAKREEVSAYYKKLQGSKDLKTDSCCDSEKPPAYMMPALMSIADEVRARYYGCGLCLPTTLEGLRVLDLGCGAGRDVFLLAQLVGEKGSVVGVDMTDEQLEVARRHEAPQAEKWGFDKPNTEFKKGFIERLDELGLEDDSFDLVVSNCVINLSPDKDAVLREVFRVLKPGGELYFSDVYADRRVPADLQRNEMLWGECLSGALYWADFLALAQKHGFADPRLVTDRVLGIDNDEVAELVSPIRFYSATYRLFKSAELDTTSEDYGQCVAYKGSIDEQGKVFEFDEDHAFEAGKATCVSRNTFIILQQSRFKPHFDFFGDGTTHFGPFPDPRRTGTIPFSSAGGGGGGAAAATPAATPATRAGSAGGCC